MKIVKHISIAAILVYCIHSPLADLGVFSYLSNIGFVSDYVLSVFPNDKVITPVLIQYFVYLLGIKTSFLLMSVMLSAQIPYNKIGNKLISFLWVLFFIKEVIFFTLINSQHYSSDVVMFVFIGSFVFISIFFSKRWDRKNNIVPKKSTTIGYKCYGKPKNFLTFLAGIFNYGGTRATLYNGRLFKVNNNKKIIEIAFTKSMKDHYYFVSFSCDKSLLERGRAITGEQINMYTNNCYSVMNLIENPYKKESFSNKIKNIFKLKINNYGMYM